ncbi:DUF4238 domain-containing protein [Enterococcus sp. OL5]|uniref:DUF4238 domain-containing protein n=1 Tax=Enterococcus sp. OL5 TaxID=2590214 RepID=UPI0011270A8D|nr:DUF4238 domain-containing protein [Enterococcus sp. OL5]TPR55234.1 DUF4238 domain-containing protein [Enterococcus sp. OL5]
MVNSFVKQEHYIPQFVLKYFENNQGNVSFVNVEVSPIKMLRGSVPKIMQERDFYEIKNEEGDYVFRNYVEKRYSDSESYISPFYNKFLEMSKEGNFDIIFKEIVESEEWAEIESSLLMYLMLLLVRGKGIKKISYSKSDLPKKHKDILHLLLTTNNFVTAEFAKKIYYGEELEEILQFIKENGNNMWDTLKKHIMENYQIRVFKVNETNRLFLSDNPVIIQKFEGEDYILPLSQELCIILVPLNVVEDSWKIDTKIFGLDNKAVNKINAQSIKNTHKLIIISGENDLEFVKEHISCS